MRIRVVILACVGAAVLGGVGVPGCVFYLSPKCSDQIRNGEETDIDCGGMTCGTCEIGQSCLADSDCEESTCERGTCTPLPCVNGVRDMAETDTDCGGGTCRKCAGGNRCQTATDCVNGMCVMPAGRCFELAVVSFADAVSYPSGTKAYVLFSGDLNGDGKIDLAAGNELDSTVSVFLGSGTGTFTRVPTPFPTGQYPTGGTIADFNRDGLLDVVTADYHGNSVSILLGGGTGMLAGQESYATAAGAETSNLAVGDLNGDNNLDVVATNPQHHSVSVFLGQANGVLQPGVILEVGVSGGSEPFSAAIGDFNGDGDNDLAVADNRSTTVIVRLGNGDGTFQPETAKSIGGTASFILITRDLNLDGKLDLITSNRGSSTVSVLLGRGDGTFRNAVTTSTGPMTGPYALTSADFNKDGVPDIITANYLSSTATVLIGVGDGKFKPAIDTGPTGMVSYGVATGDFNGDGNVDFAVSNAISNDVTVKLSTAH
jgi:FG-GAP-like repeat